MDKHVTIPFFHGTEPAKSYLVTFEMLTTLLRYKDKRELKGTLIGKLRGGAYSWWAGVPAEKKLSWTYDEMCLAMGDRWKSKDDDHTRALKRVQCTPNDIRAYCKAFDDKLPAAANQMTEDHVKETFLGKLPEDMQRIVGAFKPLYSIHALMETAMAQEDLVIDRKAALRQLQQHASARPAKRDPAPHAAPHSTPPPAAGKSSGKPQERMFGGVLKPLCSQCGFYHLPGPHMQKDPKTGRLTTMGAGARPRVHELEEPPAEEFCQGHGDTEVHTAEEADVEETDGESDF